MRLVVGLAMLSCSLGCSTGRRAVGDGGIRNVGTDLATTGIVTDPSDAGTTTFTGAAVVYGHSASTLYSIDPGTLAVAKVADFKWPGFPDEMTDIALDKLGNMTGISPASIYSVDIATGDCTLLSNFSGAELNGLSFISADQTSTGIEILVGANTNGDVLQIDPATGHQTKLGNYGGGYRSSGDLVSVEGATYATVTNGSGNDRLAKIDAATGVATIIGKTSVQGIYGLAYWKQVLYGFTDADGMVTIDIGTGKSTPAASGSTIEWYGAGVTTSAPTTIN